MLKNLFAYGFIVNEGILQVIYMRLLFDSNYSIDNYSKPSLIKVDKNIP